MSKNFTSISRLFKRGFFLRELYPNRDEVARMIFDDTRHLKEGAEKYIFEHSFERWLELHTMDYSFPSQEDGEERKVLKVAAGEIDADISQWQGVLQDLSPPQGLSSYDAAAFYDDANRTGAEIRLRISALTTIKSRLKARCLNYAIQMERQISSQDRNQAFLWDVENSVNNYFKRDDVDVYHKLQKASALVSSNEPEDWALALTEIRRAIKAAADHFYPATKEAVTCSDGKERILGDEQYLNRLNEYLASNMATATAKKLAKAELNLLDVFIRRLNDMASKGVHAAVSKSEARQGLVGTFMFLSTITESASEIATRVNNM